MTGPDLSLRAEVAAPGPVAGRSTALDVLRLVAVFMVLGRHMTPDCPQDQLGFAVCLPFRLWSRAGWAGVDLFFVLSGFLISGLLFNEYRLTGRIRLSRFFIRRGLKIYPAFYSLLILYGAVEWSFGHVREPARYLHEALFIQNYFPSVWNHTWSLAVEEHFYLIVGTLLFGLASTRRGMSPTLAIGLAILPVCLIWRIYTVHEGADVLRPTHLRMDSLMFGVMLSYCAVFHNEVVDRLVAQYSVGLVLISTLALTPLLWLDLDGRYMRTVGFTVNYLSFGAIMMVCLRHEGWFRRSATASRLAILGGSSYSIYLWHMFARRAVSYVRKEYLDVPYLLEFLVYVSFAIVIGLVAAQAVERPILRLRDRLWPAGGRRPAPAL